MKHLNRVSGIVIAVLIGTFVLQGTVYAGIYPGERTNARHNRVVGLWDVEAVVANCVTGATIASFPALHTYHLGGTGQVVPAGNPTGLSAHMMVWSHVADNDYQMAFKMYRYDPAGTYIGWVVVNTEVSINEAADEYVGSGVADFFNAAGDFLFSSCPAFIGTRFTGE